MEANNQQKKTDTEVEVLLEEWRQHPKYLSNLSKFSESVNYSYFDENEQVIDANNLARSLIYVDISVMNDEEFAKDLSARMERTLPIYVEQNMIVPADFSGTKVEKISSAIK